LALCAATACGCSQQPAPQPALPQAVQQPPVEHPPVETVAKKPVTEAPKSADAKAKTERRFRPKQDALAEIHAVEIEEPAIDAMPRVLMSVGQAATCRVKVGDALPPFELHDLSGQTHTLADLQGSKLTLVLLWSEKLLFAHEALEDMATLVFKPYHEQGLQIIAIDVGDAPETIGAAAKRASELFPVLLDPQKEYFDQVATAKLPRLYLLDAGGKILWFDIEYGRTTRRELQQAIRFKLQLNHKKPVSAARSPEL
jgi:peroxiredoxin